MAAPKKKARPRRRQEVDVTLHAAPSLTDKMKTWALWIAAIGAAATVIYKGYIWAGLPQFVDSGTFHNTLEHVKTEVGNKLVETKTEVLTHANRNTDEVRTDVGSVKKQIDSIARGQAQARIDQLELQQRVLFQQKNTLSNNLNGVQIQLNDPTKASDPFLLQRKSELQNLIAITDRDFEAIAERLRRARQE